MLFIQLVWYILKQLFSSVSVNIGGYIYRGKQLLIYIYIYIYLSKYVYIVEEKTNKLQVQ